MIVKGTIVDIHNNNCFTGEVHVVDGIIEKILQSNHNEAGYIIPGFIDAHIHIESSMLVPSEFARVAVKHGTVATVSDPHEIANVLGIRGVDFMIENGSKTPFKFNFGAPSCVPATSFESSGATINSDGIYELLQRSEIKYLAEMMNYPGVIYNDPEVKKKIEIAKKIGKPIDGHAPGLRGEDLTKYIQAGISTDHECFTYEEGLEKLQKGMKVLIREGSAAKNFEALAPLIEDHYAEMMFCSDDKHPDDLIVGHINILCARAIAKGFDLYKVLKMACLNPIEHYDLDVGQLRVGDPADFCVVKDLKNFEVLMTCIDGQIVAENGLSKIESIPFDVINNFNCSLKSPSDFKISGTSSTVRVIEALDGELVTNEIQSEVILDNGNLVSNVDQDVLKMTVANRYSNVAPAVAFIKNFGLKEGAIASSVGHDSHNIVAVGVNDESISKAVNLIIENKGGICAVSENDSMVVPLPVAGIMSDQDAMTIGRSYAELDRMAKKLGSTLNAPYMTLSFMALLVIPSLKLSDKGLFDGSKFEFTSVQL